jgi:CAS/CSE protein, C-terminus
MHAVMQTPCRFARRLHLTACAKRFALSFCKYVTQEDVTEFHPYVFQIFAQLIELRSGALPAVYMQLFAPLLTPQFWERPGNVTPLVRLLQVGPAMSTAPGP